MASASGNIILSLSTQLGPGGFASLQSLITMIGQAVTKVKEFAAENGAFARAMDQVSMDISAADRATKGLVDTQALYINAAKLEAVPSLQATSKEFETLTKFAAAFAQKTGKDVTETVNSMTTALVSGRTQGLKQFGLEVKQGSTLAETYRDLMAEVTEKVQGQEVAIRDLGDTLYTLDNNLSTMSGTWTHLIMNLGGSSNSLQAFSDKLGEGNAAVAKHEEAITEYIFSLDTLSMALYSVGTGFIFGADSMGEYYNGLVQLMALKDMEQQIANVTKFYSQESVFQGERPMEGATGSIFDEEVDTSKLRTPGTKIEDLKGKRGGGGGGGPVTIQRASGLYGYTSEEEDLFFGDAGTDADVLEVQVQQMMQLDQYGEDLYQNAADLGDILSDNVDILEDELDAVELLAASDEERLQILRERMAEDPSMLSAEEKGEVWLADYKMQQEQAALELELHEWKLEHIEEYEEAHNAKMRDLRVRQGTMVLDSAATMFGALGRLQDKEGRAAFKRAQNFAIVETLISGISASIKALNAGLSIGGPVGIAIGIAMMAFTLATTFAQVAAIKKQKYDGGGGDSAGSTPSFSEGSTASSAGSETGGGASDAGSEVKVIVSVEGALAGIADVTAEAEEYAVKTGRWNKARG